MWMLNSTVSSRLLQSMAKIEGFQHEVFQNISSCIINACLYLLFYYIEDSIVGLNSIPTGNTDRIQMDG